MLCLCPGQSCTADGEPCSINTLMYCIVSIGDENTDDEDDDCDYCAGAAL